ncbi:MAG TPA: hypothetical protein DCW83_06160 [Saprospirales bacterium]|jgi:hypothetical protein|nr:hypothetical protein [Saprospirales bacterium]
MIIDVYISEDPALNDLAARFVKWICKEYGILPRKISIEAHDIVGNNGMCFDEPDGKYTILVKDNRDLGHMFTTIAHEMIHVKQYMTQNLGKLLDDNKDLPYADRWWEEEAFSNAIPLVTRFTNLISL